MDLSSLVPSNHLTRIRRRKVEGALSNIPVATARRRSSRTVVAVSIAVGAGREDKGTNYICLVSLVSQHATHLLLYVMVVLYTCTA